MQQFARKETTESEDAETVAGVALGIFITAGLILLIIDSVTIVTQLRQMARDIKSFISHNMCA